MSRRGPSIASFVVVLCSLAMVAALPSSAARAQDPGPFEFTLAGSGSSDRDFDATQLNVDIGLGAHLGPVVLGLRQTVGFADTEVDDFWAGSTRIFGDLEIALGPVSPFIGANVGYIYGDLVHDTFIAGPEAGVKIYVGDDRDTFIFFRAEYQFFFDEADEAEGAFDDGQWVYAIGVGFRF